MMHQVMQSLLVLGIRNGPPSHAARPRESRQTRRRCWTRPGCWRSWWENLGPQHLSTGPYPLGGTGLVLMGTWGMTPSLQLLLALLFSPPCQVNYWTALPSSRFGKQRKRRGFPGLGQLCIHAEMRIPKMSIISGYSPKTSPTCASRAKALLRHVLLHLQPQPVLNSCSTLWLPINS